jgi:hypothetical protein
MSICSAGLSDHEKPLLISVNRGRRRLDLGHTKTWALIASGEIETVHVGRKRLIVVSSLEAFVARLRAERARAPPSSDPPPLPPPGNRPGRVRREGAMTKRSRRNRDIGIDSGEGQQ